MTLQEIANYGEILAAAGVIASLIFVGCHSQIATSSICEWHPTTNLAASIYKCSLRYRQWPHSNFRILLVPVKSWNLQLGSISERPLWTQKRTLG